MFHIKNITLSLSIMFLLIGCGGGGGDTISRINAPIEGTFTDSPVDGITYTINDVSEFTANGGKYTYLDGDTISFFLGNLELGTTQGKENITPLDMFNEENITIYDSRVINMAKLLQSYDSDNDPENGITLSDDIKELNTSLSIDWSNDNNITNLSDTINSSKTLRTTVETLNHLKANIPGATDPLLKYQWYLKNDGVIMNKSHVHPVSGNDLNITPVWEKYTGWNNGNPIKIQVVDTGINMNHIDLKANIDFENASSYDGTTNANPANISDDTHGTKVAGVIGAVGWNNIGIRGIAPNSKIVPFKLKSPAKGELSITYEDLNSAWAGSADAFNIGVSSNSWGSCYSQITSYETILGDASTRTLRNKKGRIYVVSSGNERISDCGANTSRMKNNPYVVTVAALNDKDIYSSYS
ncbi:MAG: subtilisin family serine protease, partial [Arcobacteraceae bacterium]